MREIATMGIDTVIASWWGFDSVEDRRLPALLAAARRADLRVALAVEPWRGRTAAQVADAIRVFVERGITDYYVYDSTTIRDTDWASALSSLDGVRVFANTMLPGRAARGGFDGLFSYDVLVFDGRSFARVCASARRLGLLCAPSVGPGFDGRRATPEQRVASRRDGRRYDAMWQAALEARADLVTITSYNEWHEGTQIEAARSGMRGYVTYDRAYGERGLDAEQAYVERTAHWVARLRAGR
jgi:hypothetical protein